MTRFDPHALLAHPPIIARQQLTRRDTILYALGVGASELPFVYEDGLRALPTMAVVLGYPGFIWRDPALGVDWRRILHGEQSTILHVALPVEGEIVGETRFTGLVDKGTEKGAILNVERTIRDGAGTLLATVRSTTMLRGNGGWSNGGPTVLGEAPPPPNILLSSPPDDVIPLATSPDQALIYRLSGDLNPLHIDPAVATQAGFPAPILHGLATYGVVGRALLMARGGNDPARMTQMNARFSAPVYPGETIETAIWDEGGGALSFRARVIERDLVVLTNGYAEIAP